MKRLAKALLARGVRTLPWGARDAIFAELTRGVGAFKGAGDLARKAGVRGFVVEGACGVIRGALDDFSGLARYAQEGAWSPRRTALFEDVFAAQGGTYVDIGANIGLTLVPVAQNPAVVCHAFEPEPANFRHLRENVAVNCRAGNVTLHHVALYDREALVSFEIAERHSGDHRISVTDAEGKFGEHLRRRIEVPARRLDDVLTVFVEPIAVKIDVQGSEPFVAAGGRHLLSRATLLSIEFWPYGMRRMRADISVLIALVKEHFSEGCISPGDEDTPIEWEPIGTLAAKLSDLAKSTNEEYWDVVVRKAHGEPPTG